MKLKSLLSPAIVLLAILILLSRTAYGCVNMFAAMGQTNWVPQATWADAKLWDGGGGSFSVTCTLSGNPNNNDLVTYDFTCNSGYSASLYETDSSGSNWAVQYSTPHGAYTFVVDYFPCGGTDGVYCDTWKSCQFGCPQGSSDCFVYNCGLDYGDCQPP